jgi:hypothetical protein
MTASSDDTGGDDPDSIEGWGDALPMGPLSESSIGVLDEPCASNTNTVLYTI